MKYFQPVINFWNVINKSVQLLYGIDGGETETWEVKYNYSYSVVWESRNQALQHYMILLYAVKILYNKYSLFT